MKEETGGRKVDDRGGKDEKESRCRREQYDAKEKDIREKTIKRER